VLSRHLGHRLIFLSSLIWRSKAFFCKLIADDRNVQILILFHFRVSYINQFSCCMTWRIFTCKRIYLFNFIPRDITVRKLWRFSLKHLWLVHWWLSFIRISLLWFRAFLKLRDKSCFGQESLRQSSYHLGNLLFRYAILATFVNMIKFIHWSPMKVWI